MRRPAFVWALLFCIALVNGFMAAPSAGHTEHDACHQTESHSSGLCAWLCASGVGIDSSVVQFAPELQLLECISVPSSDVIFTAISLPYFFRGPPRLPA